MLHADAPDAPALTYDEIIFQTRNRAYGAFNLRQQYRPTLTRALWLGVGFFWPDYPGQRSSPDSSRLTRFWQTR